MRNEMSSLMEQKPQTIQNIRYKKFAVFYEREVFVICIIFINYFINIKIIKIIPHLINFI